MTRWRFAAAQTATAGGSISITFLETKVTRLGISGSSPPMKTSTRRLPSASTNQISRYQSNSARLAPINPTAVPVELATGQQVDRSGATAQDIVTAENSFRLHQATITQQACAAARVSLGQRCKVFSPEDSQKVLRWGQQWLTQIGNDRAKQEFSLPECILPLTSLLTLYSRSVVNETLKCLKPSQKYRHTTLLLSSQSQQLPAKAALYYSLLTLFDHVISDLEYFLPRTVTQGQLKTLSWLRGDFLLIPAVAGFCQNRDIRPEHVEAQLEREQLTMFHPVDKPTLRRVLLEYLFKAPYPIPMNRSLTTLEQTQLAAQINANMISGLAQPGGMLQAQAQQQQMMLMGVGGAVAMPGMHMINPGMMLGMPQVGGQPIQLPLDTDDYLSNSSSPKRKKSKKKGKGIFDGVDEMGKLAKEMEEKAAQEKRKKLEEELKKLREEKEKHEREEEERRLREEARRRREQRDDGTSSMSGMSGMSGLSGQSGVSGMSGMSGASGLSGMA